MPPSLPLRSSSPRVFMGLKEIAGHYASLKKGFEALGIACTFVSLKEHHFAYGGEDDNWLIRLLIRSRSKKAPKALRLLKRPLTGLLFCWALLKHDVFIFGFNTSFFKNYRDLPILKFFGKKIIYQFHGSDSRPPYINGSAMTSAKNVSVSECIRLTKIKKEEIRAIDRYADVLIDTPQQGLFHERPFVLWLMVGLPNQCDPTPYTLPAPPPGKRDVVRILHCPSNPEAKGTEEIRQVIAGLIQEGLAIELVEITGQPNQVVLQQLSACDIVVDQLYADYGMPGFATEAAWFGKPVIIGGYAKDLWDEVLPPEYVPPTWYCHPDDLGDSIRYLVKNPDAREALGQRARQFVEDRWQPKQVAQRYLDLAYGKIPAGWLYDPVNIRYWQGCCFPEEKIRALIGAVIQEGGLQALQLQDKPELERLMKAAAYRESALSAPS